MSVKTGKFSIKKQANIYDHECGKGLRTACLLTTNLTLLTIFSF